MPGSIVWEKDINLSNVFSWRCKYGPPPVLYMWQTSSHWFLHFVITEHSLQDWCTSFNVRVKGARCCLSSCTYPFAFCSWTFFVRVFFNYVLVNQFGFEIPLVWKLVVCVGSLDSVQPIISTGCFANLSGLNFYIANMTCWVDSTRQWRCVPHELAWHKFDWKQKASLMLGVKPIWKLRHILEQLNLLVHTHILQFFFIAGALVPA